VDPATRWLAPAWETLPLAARRCRVRNPLNNVVQELSADQHAVLTACEGCCTLDAHAVRVQARLGLGDEALATARNWLAQFANVGLLVPFATLVARFAVPAEIAVPPFAGVFVRTCDRPALLARVLASAVALESRRGCRYRYSILDDSRLVANREANRGIVAASGLDAAHVDLSAEPPLLSELRHAFPGQHATLDWLFGASSGDATTYGRPLNLALLITAGQRLLLLDDDASLDVRAPPVADPGLEVSSAGDELFWFPDAAAMERACVALDVDPIAAHLAMLGLPLAAAWSRLCGDAGIPAVLELDAADAWRFAPDARILATQNHVVGDPGSSLFPYHLLSLSRASREALERTPGWAECAFQRRENWRGLFRRRLTPNRPLTLTTLCGLDNSHLLPPTVREHRNEDLLLGDICRRVHPAGWTLDLAFALPHRRDPAKRWLDVGASLPQEPVHFLLDYLDRALATIDSEAPAPRLLRVAAALLDLSEASDARIAECLEQQAADTSSRARFAIAEQLDDSDVSSAWKDALRPWLGSPTLSTDPGALRSRLVAPAHLRELAGRYGRALVVWPELWTWAARRNGATAAR